MWINESQSWSKNLLHPRKEWWILVTYHAFFKYTSFLGVNKRKKIKCIWTISIWQKHKDHYQKFYQVTELMTDFPMQNLKSTSHPNSFSFEQFFIFFGFNFFCQLLARHLSKEIEKMKIFSDRLKLFFAQIRPFFTWTYLALVFSVNKWSQFLSKNLLHPKTEWWILFTDHALLK